MARKLDLALIAVALAGGLALGEASQRVVLLAPPTPAVEPEDPCAEADRRYGMNRMMMLSGGYIAGVDHRRRTERFSSPPECR